MAGRCADRTIKTSEEQMVKKLVPDIVVFVLLSIAIYFAIATVLIISGKPQKPISEKGGLDFKELFVDYKGIPQLKTYVARDGAQLSYRHYPAQSDLEDDLADFIAIIRRDNPKSMIIVGGHSSGGGLAIRFAGSPLGHQADAFMLLSPYLQYNAPTVRPNAGGWARPYIMRIIGLIMLNNVGIRWFNGLTVIDFNMPKNARDGTETLSYTYRLNTSYVPHDYKKDLGCITQPLLVVVGSADEAFYPGEFEPVFSRLTKGKVALMPGVTHIGAVVSPIIRPVVKEWLQSL
jgi:non-heme chloroperoxidase